MFAALTLLSSVLLSPAPVVPAFQGCWAGYLEYRDYSDNSRQKLGALLRVYQPKGSSNWVFRYVYDDGPKKVLQESETIAIDWAKHAYTVTSEDGKEVNAYQLNASGLKPDGTGVLVLTGLGTENQVQVNIRSTLTIAKDRLDILRESSIKGQPFKFRHEYAFTFVNGS